MKLETVAHIFFASVALLIGIAALSIFTGITLWMRIAIMALATVVVSCVVYSIGYSRWGFPKENE